MKHAVVAAAMCCTLTISNYAQTPSPTATSGGPTNVLASATLVDIGNKPIGRARLQQTPHGVLVKLDLTDAASGTHALHVHDTGTCDPPSFESAGPHFSPASRKHGFLNADGPHAGDLPNIDVPTSRRHTVEFLVADVTLTPGPRSLLDENGSALVIHASADDYATDPSGESGDRIACGRIVR